VIFEETKLKGAYVINIEPIEDERGFFARSFCQKEFEQLGLNPCVAQCNISFNKKKGTLRGMHYQAAPHEEAKLVSCVKGSIYDVIIDLRPGSITYCQWVSVELSAENHKMLYIPEGFAHGFQTLEDNTEVFYQMSEFYHPESARGVRWNDPAFGIEWPLEERIISKKDLRFHMFDKGVGSRPTVIESITDELHNHYKNRFEEFGPTSKGVDWGKEEDVALRYAQMLKVILPDSNRNSETVSLLDIGCGYGGLYLYAKEKGLALNYTGIDVAENMISYAKGRFPDAEFICQNIFEFNPNDEFDYVVCNGILTQKLSASILDMDKFSNELISKMFKLCKKGIAFNVMTTKVNFMVNNLYYKNPVELFAYCLNEYTTKIKVDHAYPLYEYTIYLYK